MIITYIINRILNHYIVKQLGGTTGDTYGFVVEVTEVLLLLIYIIILSVLCDYLCTLKVYTNIFHSNNNTTKNKFVDKGSILT